MKFRMKSTLHIDTGRKSQPDLLVSPSESTPDPLQAALLTDPNLKNEYDQLDINFHNTPVNYSRQALLKVISECLTSRFMWEYIKSYKLINEISNVFHLNLIEIAYWSYLLENNTCSLMKPILTVYFTAFQAKCELNKRVLPYEMQISMKVPNFKILYYNWQLICDTCHDPSLKELNLRLCGAIGKRSRTKDYEKMIDLLMDAPKKRPREEVEEINLETDSMDQELKNFQFDLLKGEKLSPID